MFFNIYGHRCGQPLKTNRERAIDVEITEPEELRGARGRTNLNKAIMEEDAESPTSSRKSFSELLRDHIVNDPFHIRTTLVVEIIAET